MKVGAVNHGTARPAGASSTSRAHALSGASDAPGSVFTRNNALTFEHTTEPLSAPSKLELAEHFLSALRDAVTRDSEVSEIGRVDPGASLSNYFRSSMPAARALASHYPHEVKAFADALPLPADLLRPAQSALGVLDLAPLPKPPAPIGDSGLPTGRRTIEILPGENHYWSWQKMPRAERTVQFVVNAGTEFELKCEVEFIGGNLASYTLDKADGTRVKGKDFDWPQTLLPSVPGQFEALAMIRNFGAVIGRKFELVMNQTQVDSLSELPERMRHLELVAKTNVGGADPINQRRLEMLGGGQTRRFNSSPPTPLDSLELPLQGAVHAYDQFLHDVVLRGPVGPPAPPAADVAALLTEHQRTVAGQVEKLLDADTLTRPGALAAFVSALRSSGEAGGLLATRSLATLLERDLQYVMPLDAADTQLGGVAAKPYTPPVDTRSVQERLKSSLPAATSEGGGLPEGLATFAPRAHFIAPSSLGAAPSVIKRAQFRLSNLRNQLELEASRGAPGYDLRARARDEGLRVLDAELGPTLLAAADAEARAQVFARGRALLDEVDAWADSTAETLELEGSGR